MKLTISNFKAKEIDTKKGTATLFNFKGSDGIWYSSFNVEMEIDQSQIETVEKDGKTYHNIKAPPSARGGGVDKSEEILKGLRLIYTDIQAIKKALHIAALERHQ